MGRHLSLSRSRLRIVVTAASAKPRNDTLGGVPIPYAEQYVKLENYNLDMSCLIFADSDGEKLHKSTSITSGRSLDKWRMSRDRMFPYLCIGSKSLHSGVKSITGQDAVKSLMLQKPVHSKKHSSQIFLLILSKNRDRAYG